MNRSVSKSAKPSDHNTVLFRVYQVHVRDFYKILILAENIIHQPDTTFTTHGANVSLISKLTAVISCSRIKDYRLEMRSLLCLPPSEIRNSKQQ